MPEVSLKWEGSASDVKVAGSFTKWKCVPMDLVEDGVWVAKQDLDPGQYYYKYVVDGEWTVPDVEHLEEDGEGNMNGVLNIIDEFESLKVEKMPAVKELVEEAGVVFKDDVDPFNLKTGGGKEGSKSCVSNPSFISKKKGANVNGDSKAPLVKKQVKSANNKPVTKDINNSEVCKTKKYATNKSTESSNPHHQTQPQQSAFKSNASVVKRAVRNKVSSNFEKVMTKQLEGKTEGNSSKANEVQGRNVSKQNATATKAAVEKEVVAAVEKPMSMNVKLADNLKQKCKVRPSDDSKGKILKSKDAEKPKKKFVKILDKPTSTSVKEKGSLANVENDSIKGHKVVSTSGSKGKSKSKAAEKPKKELLKNVDKSDVKSKENMIKFQPKMQVTKTAVRDSFTRMKLTKNAPPPDLKLEAKSPPISDRPRTVKSVDAISKTTEASVGSNNEQSKKVNKNATPDLKVNAKSPPILDKTSIIKSIEAVSRITEVSQDSKKTVAKETILNEIIRKPTSSPRKVDQVSSKQKLKDKVATNKRVSIGAIGTSSHEEAKAVKIKPRRSVDAYKEVSTSIKNKSDLKVLKERSHKPENENIPNSRTEQGGEPNSKKGPYDKKPSSSTTPKSSVRTKHVGIPLVIVTTPTKPRGSK